MRHQVDGEHSGGGQASPLDTPKEISQGTGNSSFAAIEDPRLTHPALTPSLLTQISSGAVRTDPIVENAVDPGETPACGLPGSAMATKSRTLFDLQVGSETIDACYLLYVSMFNSVPRG